MMRDSQVYPHYPEDKEMVKEAPSNALRLVAFHRFEIVLPFQLPRSIDLCDSPAC